MQKVSVIMPCFNHARFVAESANSILGQTEQDLELIIVDDCSSDNSWEVIQAVAQGDQRVRMMRHDQNRGASRSRNDGLQAARGEFVGFCDADDIWEPQKLRAQLDLLQQFKEYPVVYCDATIVDETGMPTGQRFSQRYSPPLNPSGRLFSDLIHQGNFINMQSVLLRRECVDQVGYFDEGIKWVEDWWFWIRISHKHPFRYDPRALARYRVHSKSTNAVQKRGYGINRYWVFKRVLQEYPDLPPMAKADIRYQMGVELLKLNKVQAGRRFMLKALRLTVLNHCAPKIFAKATLRILMTLSQIGLVLSRNLSSAGSNEGQESH